LLSESSLCLGLSVTIWRQKCNVNPCPCLVPFHINFLISFQHVKYLVTVTVFNQSALSTLQPRFRTQSKVRSFGQWAAANCTVPPSVIAGQYATSNCKLLLVRNLDPNKVRRTEARSLPDILLMTYSWNMLVRRCTDSCRRRTRPNIEIRLSRILLRMLCCRVWFITDTFGTKSNQRIPRIRRKQDIWKDSSFCSSEFVRVQVSDMAGDWHCNVWRAQRPIARQAVQ